MTEAVKQWIEKTSYKETGNPRNKLFYSMGLTKGIQIAEGFAEWVIKNRYTNYGSGENWHSVGRNDIKYTLSHLLEKYLEHLSSINKEKP